jgi:predicted HicB family RNase H-like nuclease
MSRQTKSLHLRIDPKARAELERRAKADGRSLSDYTRRLIDLALETAA